MFDYEKISEDIYKEIEATYRGINKKDIVNFLKNDIDNSEIRLKIKRTIAFKEYEKKVYKVRFQQLEKPCKKTSFFFKYDKSKFEISNEFRVYRMYKTRRLSEVFFDPDADCCSNIFNCMHGRMGEEFLKMSNLNEKDFIFTNDGKGKGAVRSFLNKYFNEKQQIGA